MTPFLNNKLYNYFPGYLVKTNNKLLYSGIYLYFKSISTIIRYYIIILNKNYQAIKNEVKNNKAELFYFVIKVFFVYVCVVCVGSR